MFYTWAILIGLLPASHGIQDAIRVTHDVIASPSWKTRGNCARSWSFVHGYWQTNLPFDDAYDQNCLLKTDWSNAEHVDNIFIQVTSVTRKCSSFLAKYPNCVENVSVLINTKGRKGYRILSKIPKAVDFDNDSTLSTSVSTLELGAITTDFRLGFTAKRTSLSIQKLKIFYYKCPTRTKELTQFKETSAPGSSKHVTTITGECVTNAQVIAGTITLSCYHNGTYQTNGECVCNAGYFRNSTVCQGKLVIVVVAVVVVVGCCWCCCCVSILGLILRFSIKNQPLSVKACGILHDITTSFPGSFFQFLP